MVAIQGNRERKARVSMALYLPLDRIVATMAKTPFRGRLLPLFCHCPEIESEPAILH
jgi:hypothetical protein